MEQTVLEDIRRQFPVGSLIRNRPEVLYSAARLDCDFLVSDQPHLIVAVVDRGNHVALITQPRDHVRLYPGCTCGVERLDHPTT